MYCKVSTTLGFVVISVFHWNTIVAPATIIIYVIVPLMQNVMWNNSSFVEMFSLSYSTQIQAMVHYSEINPVIANIVWAGSMVTFIAQFVTRILKFSSQDFKWIVN